MPYLKNVPEQMLLSECVLPKEVGYSTTLSAFLNGNPVTDTIAWSSSDTSVATVSTAGRVKIVSAGKAIITGKLADGHVAHCLVYANANKQATKLTLPDVTVNRGSGGSSIPCQMEPEDATEPILWECECDSDDLNISLTGSVSYDF